MSLYLGADKVGVANTKIIEIPVPTGNYKSGTVVADDDGVLTFPELPFTPNMITVWNVQQRDLKAEAEAEGGDWEESYVRYLHTGIMLMAIYQDAAWVTQALSGESGEVYISNATIQAQSCMSVNGNRYSYRLMRSPRSDSSDFAGVEFNYAIYG